MIDQCRLFWMSKHSRVNPCPRFCVDMFVRGDVFDGYKCSMVEVKDDYMGWNNDSDGVI